MTLLLRGCNLTGGENLYTEWGTNPPTSGSDYLFVATADVDYLLSKGCTCFRLLFGWESLQPSPLAIITGSAYFNHLDSLVTYITGKGATVLLDIHGGDAGVEGGAYHGVKIPGTYGGTTVAAGLANLWGQLASRYKTNSRVLYGVMNEPNAITTAAWFAALQGVITAIRTAGASTTIVCPGTDWTGDATWVSDGNAAAFLGLKDPLNNLAAQVHLYFDANAGGGATDIVNAQIGVTRTQAAVTWARANAQKLFIAEVGLAASNSLAASAWSAFSSFMDANSDVIVGWMFWAYGAPAWWAQYVFSLCPTSNYTVDSAQMKLIAPSLTGSVVTPTPAPSPDPTVTALQAQVASLTSQLATSSASLTAAQSSVTALTAKINAAKAALA